MGRVTQLQKFQVETDNLFHISVWLAGFKSKTVFVAFVDYLWWEPDRGNVLVLLDFLAASNTINYAILLDHLARMGLGDRCSSWKVGSRRWCWGTP